MKFLLTLAFTCLLAAATVRADNIYYSQSNNAFRRIDSNGNSTTLSPEANAGVAVGPTGLIYTSTNFPQGVGDYGGPVVGIYNPATSSYISHFTPAAAPSGATAFDQAGLFYVAEGNNTIERFTANGTSLGTFASVNLNGPAGIAFDSLGNLYVANYLSNSIERFSSIGSDLGSFGTSLTNPAGIAFDGSGDLFVANNGAGTVTELSSTGSVIGSFGVGSQPIGIAFNSAGNLLITHGTGPQIEMYSTTGTDLGQIAPATGNAAIYLALTDNAGLPVINEIEAVPEPGTTAVGLLAGGTLLMTARRRRRC
jgi:hypothetical protein